MDLDVNLKQLISEIKLAKQFMVIENDHYYSPMANNYINKMEKYSSFCSLKRQKEWNTRIKRFINLIGLFDDYQIYSYLLCFIYAGLLIEKEKEGYSLDDLKELVKLQNHTSDTIFILAQILYRFSENEKFFIENVLEMNLEEFLQKVKSEYEKEKKYKLVRIVKYVNSKKI